MRNPPSPASNGRSRHREVVNGETLSARVAAARLVEETVATNLAWFFPARRARRTHASANNARGTLIGRPHGENLATQPEQDSSPQLSGTFPTRNGWVRKTTRIQKLYRAKDIIQRHFTETFAQMEGTGPLPAPREMAEPSAWSDDALVAPLGCSEVLRRLRRMRNSAPGPDGVTYDDLKRADPKTAVLTLRVSCLSHW